MSDYFNEHIMTEDEHNDWYKDPRVWVLVLALTMFILTIISESSQTVFFAP